MLSKLRPRSVYDVMAAITFFIVVAGGSAYAAATIGSGDIKNDAVLSRHIKNGAVSNSDLGAGSVSTAKVHDRSLLRRDFKAGELSATGPAGGALAGSYPSPTLRPAEQWRDLVYAGSSDACSTSPPGLFCVYGGAGSAYSVWGHRPNAGGEDFNAVGYYRDRSGIVRLKGLARCYDQNGGTACVDTPTAIFYLPPGYRPPHVTFFPTLGGGPNLHYISVYPDGKVESDGTSAAHDYLSLEGLSFRCGPPGNGCR